jgi:hypothetical protein
VLLDVRGGVDHRVAASEVRGTDAVEIGARRRGAVVLHARGAPIRTSHRDHVVAVAHETLEDVAADEARASGDEDAHRRIIEQRRGVGEREVGG